MGLAITIVTGQSGSGKSTVIRALEDHGYQCVDNLPPSLVEPLLETLRKDAASGQQVAVVMDARQPVLLREAPSLVQRLRGRSEPVRLVYLEAREEVLLRRYSETRRRHPLDHGVGLRAAVAKEHEILSPLRELADDTLDTSALSPHALRTQVVAQLVGVRLGDDMRVAIVSFGFKHGAPLDADLLFDVRFLPNPYFVAELRPFSGLDERVRRYVLDSSEGAEFIRHTGAYLQYLVPRYQREGKLYLTVGVGCTGGQHRSVSIAWRLAEVLRADGVRVDLRHRDIEAAPPEASSTFELAEAAR